MLKRLAALIHATGALMIASVLGILVFDDSAAVELVESVDQSACQLIERQKCGTKRQNAYVRCVQWHERRATQVGATHIVLTNFEEHGSFLFIGRDDVLEADYYQCIGNRGGAAPPRPRSGDTINIGSGFFITDACHFVTNHHVIDGAEHIVVTLHSGDVITMDTIATDPPNDIAILEGDCESTPLPLKKTSGALKGQDVFTIGYPLVPIQGTEQKASFGRINADSGIRGDIRFLQIDVPVQPGNSGGPLVDDYGNVVGIVTARLDELLTLQATGSLPQNVNYALKIDYLYPLLKYKKIEPNMPISEQRGSAISVIADSEKSVAMVKAISTR